MLQILYICIYNKLPDFDGSQNDLNRTFRNIHNPRIMIDYPRNRVAVAFSAILLMCSCVDSSYDFGKGIDTTVSIGGEELSLPLGSTKKMTVSSMLGLEDNENIMQDGDGNLYLEIAGEKQTFSTVIENVTVGAIEPMILDMDFGSPVIPDGEYSIDLSIPSTELGNLSYDEVSIPEQISALHYVEYDGYCHIEISIPDAKPEHIKIQSMHISFPEWLMTDDSRIKDNILTITGDVYAGKSLTTDVKVKGIDFSKAPGSFDPEKHTVSISGEMTVDCSITAYFTGEGNTEKVRLHTELEMKNSSGETDLSAAKIVCGIDYKTETIEGTFDIEMSDEFISDDIILDLSGPSASLEINNMSPFTGRADCMLRTLDNSGSQIASVSFSMPEIAAEATSRFRISEQGNDADGFDGVGVKGFDDIFFKLPKSAGYSTEFTVSEPECSIVPGSSYSFEVNSSINIPLSFGPEVNAAYDYVIEGIGESLKGTDIREIVIRSTLNSSLPFGIRMEGRALDASGNAAEDIRVTFDEGEDYIFFPSEEGISEREFKINVSAADGNISEINSIAISITILEGSGKSINANDYILLKDISIMIPGGLEVNLKDGNEQ